MSSIPVETFAADADATVASAETDAASSEITGLVMQLSSADLRDPEKVAKLLGMQLQRARSGADRSTHRLTYSSNGRSRHGWLDSARQELYLEPGDPAATKVELEIGLASATCFRARSLARRFYADDANPTLSTDGVATVVLRIEGRKVLVERRVGDDCVNFIRLFQNPPVPTPAGR